MINIMKPDNSLKKQEAAIKMLQEIEENFNSIFHNAADAILLIQGESFVDCNEATVAMLGAQDKEQVMHSHPADLSPPMQPDGRYSKDKAEEMIAIARENGLHRFEWMHKRFDGKLFPVEVSLTVIKKHGKSMLHVHWKDISKQKQYENNLKNAARQAREAERAKADFLANMSHEIRTPMNGIIGMAALLKDIHLPVEAQNLVDKLHYSAISLLGLLNDILDFSKIDAGQLDLDPHDFNLTAMLDNIISVMAFQAREKQISLENISDCSENIWVKADELRIKQIVNNLIGNAIKFTNRGGIKVKMDVTTELDGQITLGFSVADSGIGIESSKKKHIFSSFTQAESSTTRKFGGTGLGLAICKQLVELMHGQIWCESEIGKGSTFYFTVKVLPAWEQNHQETLSVCDFTHRLNVLLVEDNRVNQELLTLVLQKVGHQVQVADNGLHALECLATDDFDLIIMDVQMPEMDGLTATAVIRQCETGQNPAALKDKNLAGQLGERMAGRHIPIIAITANAMPGDKKKCLDTGMDDYLTKPFMPKDIARAMDRLGLLAQRPVSDGSHGANNLQSRSFRHLSGLYSFDYDTVKTLLMRACENLGKLGDDLDIAWQQNNPAAVEGIARTLEGLFINLGLNDIAATVKPAAYRENGDREISGQYIKHLNELMQNFNATDY